MHINGNKQFMKLLPIAALCLTLGNAKAAEPLRVMFVSKLDVQPMIVDLQGRESPAKKGMIIEPGFTVKVPEGATLQMMTSEKSILAVRPNSLLKLETLGDGNRPHVLKLNTGGIRVANSEKKPHKFEVNTPNARMKFDKGDHEAFYVTDGKLKDGRWGTFVRGTKDDVILSTLDGDVKVTQNDLGYVPGSEKGAPRLLAKLDDSGKTLRDVVSYVPGAKDIGTEVIETRKSPGDEKLPATNPVRVAALPKLDPVPLPEIKEIVTRDIVVPVAITMTTEKLSMPDLKPIPGIEPVKTAFQELTRPIIEVELQKTTTGEIVPVVTDGSKVSYLGTTSEITKTFTIEEINKTALPLTKCDTIRC